MQIVQITNTDSVFEAHAIRGFLESHGIACFIADEHLINADWALKHAVGDVRINVYEDRLEEAKVLLRDLGTEIKTEEQPEREQKSPSFFNIVLSAIITFFSGVPTPVKDKNRKK